MTIAHVKLLPDGTWANPHLLEAHLNGTSELAEESLWLVYRTVFGILHRVQVMFFVDRKTVRYAFTKWGEMDSIKC